MDLLGGNVSLDLFTRGEEEAVVWEDAVLGVEPGVEHTLVLQKNQAKSEISQRFTWFPQSCWHSSSVSTFSWNAFCLFHIWQSGQNFSKLKLSGCIYLQKMHKYCMSYIYLLHTVRICKDWCSFVRWWRVRWGRRNFSLGNKNWETRAKQMQLPVFLVGFKFHTGNQRRAN